MSQNRAATLDKLETGRRFVVESVCAEGRDPEWEHRLEDLGFLPGEPGQLMARVPGGDPLVVRIGLSTFALRRAEAGCIRVRVEDSEQ